MRQKGKRECIFRSAEGESVEYEGLEMGSRLVGLELEVCRSWGLSWNGWLGPG